MKTLNSKNGKKMVVQRESKCTKLIKKYNIQPRMIPSIEKKS